MAFAVSNAARLSLSPPEGGKANDAAGFASRYGPFARSPKRAFDAGLRPDPFPDRAASLLPGLLAATRTGLTPAGDDEHERILDLHHGSPFFLAHLRMLIDKALTTRGYVLLPLAAPHHRRDGLVFGRPSTQGQASSGPLPAAVEATTACPMSVRPALAPADHPCVANPIARVVVELTIAFVAKRPRIAFVVKRPRAP